MHVKVRDFLQAGDAVVIVQRQTVGSVRPDQSGGDAAHGVHQCGGFVVCQVEDGGGVPAGDDETLPKLKLAYVDDCQRQFGLFHESFIQASGYQFAEYAGRHYREIEGRVHRIQ